MVYLSKDMEGLARPKNTAVENMVRGLCWTCGGSGRLSNTSFRYFDELSLLQNIQFRGCGEIGRIYKIRL